MTVSICPPTLGFENLYLVKTKRIKMICLKSISIDKNKVLDAEYWFSYNVNVVEKIF